MHCQTRHSFDLHTKAAAAAAASRRLAGQIKICSRQDFLRIFFLFIFSFCIINLKELRVSTFFCLNVFLSAAMRVQVCIHAQHTSTFFVFVFKTAA